MDWRCCWRWCSAGRPSSIGSRAVCAWPRDGGRGRTGGANSPLGKLRTGLIRSVDPAASASTRLRNGWTGTGMGSGRTFRDRARSCITSSPTIRSSRRAHSIRDEPIRSRSGVPDSKLRRYEVSVMWLKRSERTPSRCRAEEHGRLQGLRQPAQVRRVLPLLWREGDDAIYECPAAGIAGARDSSRRRGEAKTHTRSGHRTRGALCSGAGRSPVSARHVAVERMGEAEIARPWSAGRWLPSRSPTMRAGRLTPTASASPSAEMPST